MHWSEVTAFGMKTVKQTASIYRVVPKGVAMHRLMTIILSILNRLKFFFSGRCLGKFAVRWLLKVPPPTPCICCYTTL